MCLFRQSRLCLVLLQHNLCVTPPYSKETAEINNSGVWIRIQEVHSEETFVWLPKFCSGDRERGVVGYMLQLQCLQSECKQRKER